MDMAKKFFKENVEDIFIAYAFPYIGEAIEELDKAPPDVEAVVIQPYYKGHFVSAKDAMHLYRKMKDGKDIPILFTSRTRHQDQYFEYGSRLVDLRSEAERKVVEQNIDSGKWLMWDESLYAKNFLIVQRPIKELQIKPPVKVATNLLSGPRQGDPVKAVAIPSPKVIGIIFRHLFEDL